MSPSFCLELYILYFSLRYERKGRGTTVGNFYPFIQEELMEDMDKDSFCSLSHRHLEFGRVHLRQYLHIFHLCWETVDCTSRDGVLRNRELWSGHVQGMCGSNLPYMLQLPDDLLNENITKPSAIGLAHFSPSSQLSKTFWNIAAGWSPLPLINQDKQVPKWNAKPDLEILENPPDKATSLLFLSECRVLPPLTFSIMYIVGEVGGDVKKKLQQMQLFPGDSWSSSGPTREGTSIGKISLSYQ